MDPKQLQEHYDRLAKQGRAEFKLVFRNAPGDNDLASNDPVANVTITATDTATDKKFTQSGQMSKGVSEMEVAIPVLNVIGVMKRTWNRICGNEQPQLYSVIVVVQPHEGWESCYQKTTFKLNVKLGRNTPTHIWMEAKQKNMQSDNSSPPSNEFKL